MTSNIIMMMLFLFMGAVIGQPEGCSDMIPDCRVASEKYGDVNTFCSRLKYECCLTCYKIRLEAIQPCFDESAACPDIQKKYQDGGLCTKLEYEKCCKTCFDLEYPIKYGY